MTAMLAATAIEIDPLRRSDWPLVKAIYEEGIATGTATFETEAPTWEEWHADHLSVGRLVAGIWTLQAGVFPENTASLALHQRCGFRAVGVRERIGRLGGEWKDVVLLERRSEVIR